MHYTPQVSDRLIVFFLQKNMIDQKTLEPLKVQAVKENRTILELVVQEKPALSVTTAQLVSQLTKLPYRNLPTSEIKTSEEQGEELKLTLQNNEVIRGTLDPFHFPVEKRNGLTILDWSTVFSLLSQKLEAAGSSSWELIDGDANDQLDRILGSCVDLGASDIHIDIDVVDFKLVSRIRFRIDGLCRDMVIDPRKSIYEGIVSRLKTLSFCRLDESRVPQDGRIPFVHNGKNYEFRISFNPVTKKNEQLEKVVLRQMADVNKCNLHMLGILPYNLKLFKEAIDLPYGFNIVTGPTGSGKTTTLYSVLQEIDRSENNVCSIEDPIEAEIDRVNQTQARHDIGLDFARVLRALLRQDPDVIMVGEMRDLETAEVALEAALTGHVVWSTLHTNSAVASISRLIQMGIKDYMAANALAFIVAQRLVQRVCTDCRFPHPEADDILQGRIYPAFKQATLEVKEELQKALEKFSIYKAKRNGGTCKKCEGMGYKGRVGVLEVLKMNDAMREIILRDKGNEIKLQEEAVKSGMMTMEQYGYLKVLSGETTVESVLSVVKG